MIVSLPTPEELRPSLDRLEANAGSIVLIVIEVPEICNFTRTMITWLSKQEREALRRALLKARAKRQSHDVDRGDLSASKSTHDSRPPIANP